MQIALTKKLADAVGIKAPFAREVIKEKFVKEEV